MKTFHIRQPQKHGPLLGQTLCGAPKTDHDIKYTWQAIPAGPYEPCAACVAARAAERKARRRRPVSVER
jgi:hypothetical protein